MGADIHIIVQYKEKGKWETYFEYPDYPYEINEDRDYQSFSLLAGVRGSFESIQYPRGLPHDLEMEMDEEGCMCHKGKWLGNHSHSYLTLSEIVKKKVTLLEATEFWLIYRIIEDLHRIQEKLGDFKNNNIRIVFGFDS